MSCRWVDRWCWQTVNVVDGDDFISSNIHQQTTDNEKAYSVGFDNPSRLAVLRKSTATGGIVSLSSTRPYNDCTSLIWRRISTRRRWRSRSYWGHCCLVWHQRQYYCDDCRPFRCPWRHEIVRQLMNVSALWIALSISVRERPENCNSDMALIFLELSMTWRMTDMK